MQYLFLSEYTYSKNVTEWLRKKKICMHYLHALHTEKESNKADGAKYKQLENLGREYTQVSDIGLATFL